MSHRKIKYLAQGYKDTYSSNLSWSTLSLLFYPSVIHIINLVWKKIFSPHLTKKKSFHFFFFFNVFNMTPSETPEIQILSTKLDLIKEASAYTKALEPAKSRI